MLSVDGATGSPVAEAGSQLLRSWGPLAGAWLLLGLAYAASFRASDWGEDPVGVVAHDTRPTAPAEPSVDWWNPQTWWSNGDEASDGAGLAEGLRRQLDAANAEVSALRKEMAELRRSASLRGDAHANASVASSGGDPVGATGPSGAVGQPEAFVGSSPEVAVPLSDAELDQQPPQLPGIVDGAPPAWHSYVHPDPKANPSAEVATAEGLPSDRPGHWQKASWLYNDDKLIVDARPRRGPGSGGILVAFAILLDHKFGAGWGKKGKGEEEMKRPKWLRSCLAATRTRVRRFGHAMIIRWRPTLKVPKRVLWECHRKFNGNKDEQKCIHDEERETFNWEKELMILEYLSSPENFSHVLMMDADAALVHPDHDTLRLMVQELERSGKDLFLADEDWQANGRGRINGGLLFAANTEWTRQLFQDMLAAHMTGTVSKPKSIGGTSLTCNSNEQLCLNGMKSREGFMQHAAIWSGQTWNRGGCVLKNCFRGGGAMNEEMGKLRMRDPTMEIMHFMGGAKENAVQAMCHDGVNVTGEPLDGYGCS